MTFCARQRLLRFTPQARLTVSLIALLLVLGTSVQATPSKVIQEPQRSGSQIPADNIWIVIPDYQSPLQSFRFYEYGETIDWKQANDTVREIGGWREYAREAYDQEMEERKKAQEAKP